MRDIYLDDVLRNVPRILGQLNRNVASDTYGCFDRYYWNYKTVDFANALAQESVLTLALLYKIKTEKNVYYGNKTILNWINAGLDFWTTLQHSNGSFSEWYPRDYGYVTTAFVSYAVSETLLQLEDEIINKFEIIKCLKRAGDFIMGIGEKKALNQVSGAIIALYNIYLLTNESKYKKDSEAKIDFLIENQTEEGWFYEYGGMDVGYHSLTIDYLAKYYQKTSDRRLFDVLKKAIDGICYFLHPNGTFGGEYGSRETEYLTPHGFEILANEIPMAARVSKQIKNALRNGAPITLSSLDERFLIDMSFKFLQAYIDSKQVETNIQLPYEKNFVKDMHISGNWIFSDGEIYLIVNYKKGGVTKLFFKNNNPPIHDTGIMLIMTNNKKLTSCRLTDKNIISISKKSLELSGCLWEVPDVVMSPVDNILLRTFQQTIGRNKKIGLFIREMIRDALMKSSKRADIEFNRKIEVSNDDVVIIDMVDLPYNTDKLIIGSKYSFTHSFTSSYFQQQELNNSPFIFNKGDIKKYLGTSLRITRCYSKTEVLAPKLIFGN